MDKMQSTCLGVQMVTAQIVQSRILGLKQDFFPTTVLTPSHGKSMTLTNATGTLSYKQRNVGNHE